MFLNRIYVNKKKELDLNASWLYYTSFLQTTIMYMYFDFFGHFIKQRMVV